MKTGHVEEKKRSDGLKKVSRADELYPKVKKQEKLQQKPDTDVSDSSGNPRQEAILISHGLASISSVWQPTSNKFECPS